MLESGEIAAGIAILGAVLGACAVVAWLVVGRGLGWLRGTARAMALLVTFTGAVVVTHLVPGAVGLFVPAAVVAAAMVLLVATVLLTRGARPADAGEAHGQPAGSRERRGEWIVAGGVALLLAGSAVALLRDLAGAPITSIDAQNFQVPIVARWIQGESLWGLHQFIADYSNATYPQHGNLLVSAVMLPFDSAFLARLVAAPYWAMTAVGVYAVSREIGAPRPAAIAAAAALAAVPVMVRAGLEGVQTDAPMLACLAAGVLFLLRHHRSGERRELVLAGVALGLAFGTKWYAVTGVAAVCGVWLLARRRVWPDAALVAALVAVAGGFWMLRNLVEAGNPMFPQPLGPFDAPRDTLREQGGFTLLHYIGDFDVWRTYLRPAFGATFGWTGAVLAGGALAAALLRPRGRVLALLAGTLVLALVYLATPYSAFGPEGRPVLAAASTRYGLPALIGAAVLAAWAARHPRLRAPLIALLALAALNGLRDAFELGLAKTLGGTLAVAAAVWAVPRVPARVLIPVGAAVAALAVAATADRANDRGYGEFDPALAWIERYAPAGAAIGLAGVWSTDGVSPALAAFGPRLGNRVEYVGEFREHMLRGHATAATFADHARAFDLLVVGLEPPARELDWARSAGFAEVARSDRLALLRRSTVGRR